MSGYYAPSGGTATGTLNSTSITIAGADVLPILPGMLIYFGSRTVVDGPGYLIASVVRTDASNGTITLASGLAAAQSSQPFMVDLAQAGNAATYASFMTSRILNAMTEILGLGTTVDNTSKRLVLNSATSGALGRIDWEIAGVDQFRIDRRAIGGVEHLAIQSTNDGGTNWVDAILINRTAGTVTFAAAPTFSAPLLLPAGTNLAPAVSRTGDTNTGVYFPAADVVAVATGGVERMRIDAAGNMAVGTTVTRTGLNVGTQFGMSGVGGFPNLNYNAYFGSGAWRASTAGFGHVAFYDVAAGVLSWDMAPSSVAADASLGLVRRLNLSAAGVLSPGVDNTQNLGASSFRWATVFAGTGTINTSDARQKVKRGGFTDAELDAWSEVQPLIFRWKDSVERKGDAARQHAGYIAQEISAAFAAHGLDAADYGLWCEDPVTRPVTRTVTRKVQAARKVKDTVTEIEIRDGVPVQVAKTVERDEPVTEMVAIRDEAGKHVRDADGNPLMHPVPVMVDTEVEETTHEPDGTRLGLRYDQCAVFEAAWCRREMAYMAARLTALEARA